MTFHSQHKQDYYLETQVFKGFKNGVFVDVGAHDGICLNNTLYFEREHQWTGINIEPNPDVFAKLVANRPACTNLNIAIDAKEGTAEFICNSGYTEMLSGLKDYYHPSHTQRLGAELKVYGGETKVIQVQTNTLANVLQNTPHVHYLSVDAEGGELPILKSIDYSKTFIDIIGFENNYQDTTIKIVQFLIIKGFVVLAKGPDVFMINKNSQFRT